MLLSYLFIAGLLPIIWGSGTGSEIMRRIAAPIVGSMITAPLLSMLVIPAAYRVFGIKRHALGIAAEGSPTPA